MDDERMRNRLPGVRRIWMKQASELGENLQMRQEAGIPISVYDPGEEVKFSGTATAEWSTEYDNNGLSGSVTLKFATCSPIRVYNRVFVVEDNNGARWLIGTREKPYPTLKSTRTTGSESGDAAVWSHEVKWVCLNGAIPIVY